VLWTSNATPEISLFFKVSTSYQLQQEIKCLQCKLPERGFENYGVMQILTKVRGFFSFGAQAGCLLYFRLRFAALNFYQRGATILNGYRIFQGTKTADKRKYQTYITIQSLFFFVYVIFTIEILHNRYRI